jgi:hypothetical protein
MFLYTIGPKNIIFKNKGKVDKINYNKLTNPTNLYCYSFCEDANAGEVRGFQLLTQVSKIFL